MRYVVLIAPNNGGHATKTVIPCAGRVHAVNVQAALNKLYPICYVALQVPAMKGNAYIRPEQLDDWAATASAETPHLHAVED